SHPPTIRVAGSESDGSESPPMLRCHGDGPLNVTLTGISLELGTVGSAIELNSAERISIDLCTIRCPSRSSLPMIRTLAADGGTTSAVVTNSVFIGGGSAI